ncbi:hypothetical protein AZ895_01380 [Staphylococcus epidermidis]|nr:hypothetical protein AZ895_01380 [Staphylococcus epidermidis]
MEKASSDASYTYINVGAVNSKDNGKKTYRKIIDLYHSKEAQKALKEDTKDGEKPVDLSKKEIEEIENELAKK